MDSQKDSPAPRWSLQSEDYDFELFIDQQRQEPDGLDALHACLLWEYGRECPLLRDSLTRPYLIHRLQDEMRWATKLLPFDFGDFPERPWQQLSARAQKRITQYSIEEELFVYPSLRDAALRNSIDPFSKEGKPVPPQRVFVVTTRTLERHGVTKILDRIKTELQELKGREKAVAGVGRGSKINDVAKRLRVLGYCRLRAKEGQTRADRYLEDIRNGGAKVCIKDWARARAALIKDVRGAFPFLPPAEKPIHSESALLK